MTWTIKRNGKSIQQVVITTATQGKYTNICIPTTQELRFDTEKAAHEVANCWVDVEVVKVA